MNPGIFEETDLVTDIYRVSLADLARVPVPARRAGDYLHLNGDAKPTLADIAECVAFSPGDGRIWMNDQRMVLMHGGALGSLRRELIDSLGVDKARGLFTRMGYLSGSRDARMTRERWPDADLGALYTARLHSLEGMVKVEPLHFNFDPERRHFDGEYLWHDSIEADEHIAAYGIGTSPSCWMSVGYAIGYGSTLIGHLVICREVGCRSMGDNACRLIARSAELWDDVREDMHYLNAEDFVETPALRRRTVAVPAEYPRGEGVSPNLPYNTAMVGASSAFNAACHQLQRVAPTDATVLFTGESGVGKEMFASTVHRISPRADKPFIAINCAAIPETLIESELFGVERGAFTNATQSRPGRFERANGGTLFLDEIGTLSLVAQGKLLRALQEGEIERVGGSHSIRVDVRVVAATNVGLRRAVCEGTFREDLFYRLNVFPIELPPLRDRRDDIPLLLNHFLTHYCLKYKRNVSGFSLRVMKTLLNYSFPGNIRELQNLVERGVISATDGSLIDLCHMFNSGESIPSEVLSVAFSGESGTLAREPEAPRTGATIPVGGESLLQTLSVLAGEGNGTLSLEQIERTLVENAVEQTRGNLSAAARLLGMTRSQLAYRCEKYRLDEATIGGPGAARPGACESDPH
jgi:transcriptional regulator with GAF, ATPase, and Fis domain